MSNERLWLETLWQEFKDREMGKVKEMYTEAVISTNYHKDDIYSLVYGNAVPTPQAPAYRGYCESVAPKNYTATEVKAAIKKKDKTMCYECDDDFCSHPQSDESKQRMYLENRLSDIASGKRVDAYKAFGLQNDVAPTNAEDLIKRIKEGKFTYDKKAASTGWHNIFLGITWRDPDLKEDKAGFETYEEALYDQRTKALDTIKIASPTDGLKALQAFEVWEPAKNGATKN